MKTLRRTKHKLQAAEDSACPACPARSPTRSPTKLGKAKWGSQERRSRAKSKGKKSREIKERVKRFSCS